MNIKKTSVIIALTLGLAACESMGGPKQTAGTLLGAAGGAVIGAQFGGGTGQLVGTAIGTAAGAIGGGYIGKKLDDDDRAKNAYYPYNR
jgi:uncharacterized protein YcfJ